MDHQEEHHQHHRKERELKKEHEKEREREEDKRVIFFHPAWFVALGVVFIAVAVLVWTFLL